MCSAVHSAHWSSVRVTEPELLVTDCRQGAISGIHRPVWMIDDSLEPSEPIESQSRIQISQTRAQMESPPQLHIRNLPPS